MLTQNTPTIPSASVTNSTGSLKSPFQYAGREFDSETGLYLNRTRYYDPSDGQTQMNGR
jgi:RHS repeat-associated protein